MDFKFTTNDDAETAWIEAARVSYNDANPQNQLADAAAYFQWLVSGWFAAGALTNRGTKLDAAVAKAKHGDTADLVAVAAELATKPMEIAPVKDVAEASPAVAVKG